MSVGVLVAFWLIAGVAVVLVAMSATRRRRSGKPSKGNSWAFGLSVAIGFVLVGAAIPAWVMISNADADENARGGVDLTTEQVEGRELFSRYCATCHTLAASNAVGKVGPNLDRMRPTEELTVNAIEEGRARGMGQMPAEVVSGTEAQAVASYVAAVAGH